MRRSPSGAGTRRRTSPISVWVLPEERDTIMRYAVEAGLPASTYLRVAGMGERPPSALDLDRIRELLKVNADLGRLGGLLKLWLSNRDRFVPGGPGQGDVTSLLDAIRETQAEIYKIAETVLKRF